MALVEEGRFVRTTIEKSVVKLACERHWNEDFIAELEENMNMQEYNVKIGNYLKFMHLDQKFHGIIFKVCKKERTCALIKEMNSDFYRVRMLSLKVIIDMDNFLLQHREIMNAIKEKDAVRAEKAMEIHLTSLESDQEVMKKEYPHFIKMN
jgi:DNA-binding GntR family transcriptional regulator